MNINIYNLYMFEKFVNDDFLVLIFSICGGFMINFFFFLVIMLGFFFRMILNIRVSN